MTHPNTRTSDEEFIRLFEELGATGVHQKTGLTLRRVYQRRAALERKYKRQIVSPSPRKGITTRVGIARPGRLEVECSDGVVLVGSDMHYWPGPPSTAHRAFVKFCQELKPATVIANGDVIDACSISRHPPIGWTHMPTVQEEIEASQDRLGEIEAAAFRARKIWPLGNHDGRFETRLATIAPEFAKVRGTSLKDHFPVWEPCWSVFINGNVVVKHRFRGGIHAVYNNALASGLSMITGHLHSAKVTPWSDYTGTRYGVDTGCIADPSHPAFEYLEDNPRNWRAAFAVLTFHQGRLMMPELVQVWDQDHVEFRGEVIHV